MSTKIAIHDVVEVREQITHYTNNIKFICRNIIVVDGKGNEIEISFFTEQDERSVQPLTTKRSYHNA
jgi:hypothetical protein